MNSERELLLDEVITAYLKAVEAGHAPNRNELLACHPSLATDLAAFFAAESQVNRVAAPLRTPSVDDPTTGLGEPAPTGPGTRVGYFGDYHLLEEIGRGGMGVVYKARQETLKRTVALKMILSGQLATDSDVKRFRAEADAAAKLDHPGIVTVFEVGQHDGQHYFSMAFVEGESLAHRLAQKLPAPREAAELTRKVAEAVAYAHVEGVIHRDLKPANILIDKSGQPRLTDFGLAKRVEGDSSLTATGQILGTPSYMPPEQASGRTDVGPLADVYSLGAILYCLLTGRPPFQADNPLDTLMQVLQREPVPPRQLNAAVPADLETITLKCLEKESKKRYASAQELAGDLDRFLTGRPIHARPVGQAERAWRWCRRNPALAATAAALVIVLIGGTVTSAVFASQARNEARQSAELTVQAKALAAEKGDLAIQAQADANRATASERLTKRYLYSAHMNLAHEAWKSGNVLRLEQLLDQHRPAANEDDLRSFEWNYLWREVNRQKKTIPLTTTEQVGTIKFSADGRWLGLGVRYGGYMSSRGDDRTFDEIRFWDVAAGAVHQTLRSKKNPEDSFPDEQFQELVFTPDGKLFAIVVFDHLMVWHGTKPDGWGQREKGAMRIVVRETETLKVRATIPLPNFELGDRVAISPDHRVVAVAYTTPATKDPKRHHRILVWNLPEKQEAPAGEGKLLAQIEKDFGDDMMARFAFSSDSLSLMWSDVRHKPLTVTSVSGTGPSASRPFQGYRLVVSPDGKYLANASERDGRITVHEADTGKDVHSVPYNANLFARYAFSPDSRLLAVSRGQTLDVWDLTSKKQIGEIRGPNTEIGAVGFTPDSKSVITVSPNRHTGGLGARFWDVALRPGPDSFNFAANPLQRPHPSGQNAHAFVATDLSPDGKTIAVVWNWSPTGPDQSRAIVLHDIATGLPGKQLLHLKWDRDDETLTPRYFQPGRVIFSPDGKRVALCSTEWGTAVQLWRLEPGTDGLKATFEKVLPVEPRYASRMPVSAFSPDGTKLAYVVVPHVNNLSEPDRLHILDLATSKETVLPADPKAWFPYTVGLSDGWGKMEWGGSINGIVYTSDGKRMITSHVSQIMAWDAATGEVITVLSSPRHFGYARQPALSKDDRTVAVCNDDHSISLWDVSEPELQRVRDELKRRTENPKEKNDQPASKPRVVIRGHGGNVTAMAFHPDGKTLASSSADGTIRIWDTVTGELRLTLETPACSTLLFTRDGKTLISAGQGGEVKMWNAGSAR